MCESVFYLPVIFQSMVRFSIFSLNGKLWSITANKLWCSFISKLICIDRFAGALFKNQTIHLPNYRRFSSVKSPLQVSFPKRESEVRVHLCKMLWTHNATKPKKLKLMMMIVLQNLSKTKFESSSCFSSLCKSRTKALPLYENIASACQLSCVSFCEHQNKRTLGEVMACRWVKLR